MMKVNWSHLRDVYTALAKTHHPDHPIVFHYTPTGHDKKKNTIKFKDFLRFFWGLYDSKRVTIPAVTVTDAKTDRVIYKHKPSCSAQEKKPEGDGKMVETWVHLSDERKKVLMRILLSQIKSEAV